MAYSTFPIFDAMAPLAQPARLCHRFETNLAFEPHEEMVDRRFLPNLAGAVVVIWWHMVPAILGRICTAVRPSVRAAHRFP